MGKSQAGADKDSKFKSGASYVIEGGKKMVAQGYAKAKGASRTAIGKRK